MYNLSFPKPIDLRSFPATLIGIVVTWSLWRWLQKRLEPRPPRQGLRKCRYCQADPPDHIGSKCPSLMGNHTVLPGVPPIVAVPPFADNGDIQITCPCGDCQHGVPPRSHRSDRMNRETLAFNQQHIQVYIRDIKIDSLKSRLNKYMPRHRLKSLEAVTRELLIHEPYLANPNVEATRTHTPPDTGIPPIHCIRAQLEQRCQNCSAESDAILRGMSIHHTAAGWCHAGCG